MTPDEMDKAAEEAEKSFPTEGKAVDVVQWWKSWFMKAGHKRLGRILVGKAKVQAA